MTDMAQEFANWGELKAWSDLGAGIGGLATFLGLGSVLILYVQWRSQRESESHAASDERDRIKRNEGFVRTNEIYSSLREGFQTLSRDRTKIVADLFGSKPHQKAIRDLLSVALIRLDISFIFSLRYSYETLLAIHKEDFDRLPIEYYFDSALKMAKEDIDVVQYFSKQNLKIAKLVEGARVTSPEEIDKLFYGDKANSAIDLLSQTSLVYGSIVGAIEELDKQLTLINPLSAKASAGG
jgi:hypothetical protein